MVNYCTEIKNMMIEYNTKTLYLFCLSKTNENKLSWVLNCENTGVLSTACELVREAILKIHVFQEFFKYTE